MIGFSSPNTFTLCNKPFTPVILRGTEGEFAESTLPKSTLSLSVFDDRLERPFSLKGELFFHLKETSPNGTGETACGLL